MADTKQNHGAQTGNSAVGSTGMNREDERPDWQGNTPASAGDLPSPESSASTDSTGSMGSTHPSGPAGTGGTGTQPGEDGSAH
jgi:hypothetical protein